MASAIGRVADGRAPGKRLARGCRGHREKLLWEQCGTEIVAYVKQIHKIYAEVDPTTVTQEQVEANIVRCPDPACVEEMIGHIEWARRQGDSLGAWWKWWRGRLPQGWGAGLR